ncbi:MAG: ROK family protein [Clostridia bacterium]|nr:ROK family protein [Clostridia bacterium]
MNYIGIDIGGMSAKAGIVDENGNILFKRFVETNSEITSDEFEALMAKLVLGLIGDAKLTLADIVGVGLGFPGSIYGEKGIVRYCCNLNLKKVPFADELKKLLGEKIEVKIGNDANLATLAETKFGAAKGAKNTILFTLGTGVGSGFVSDGKLVTGNLSAGAEGGHTVLRIGGVKCGCGRRGCFEAYASATALLRQTKESAEKNPQSLLAQMIVESGLNGKTVFDAAKAGDKTANAVVKKYIKYVGEGVTNFVNIFFPEVVIIGGGVSNQGDYLIKPLQKFVSSHLYGKQYNPKVKVVRAALGNDAGIIGAAALFM